ncbi:MAG: peptidoglycan editing factor PgeF [Gammaproteobacteria bacterium]|nr:peptidoglycan editing factor PgeF [Gammaproteobacteria bacterium]
MSLELIAAEWPATHVVACSTTRTGGVSDGVYASLNLGAHVGDRKEAVAENRRRLVACCDLPSEPLWLNQVHGSYVIYSGAPAFRETTPNADAIVSRDGRDVLGILTADCLPIMLCSTSRSEIAAMHCGWRSLSAGIVAETINSMASDPSELLAWLGPAISQPAFEVGDEVRDIFLAGIENAATCFEPNDNGRWQADLYGLASLYLAAAGVERAYGGGHCTYTDEERFFSHRRDGQCGRLATLIWSRGSP